MSSQDITPGLSEKSEINGRIAIMRQIADILASKARGTVLANSSDMEQVANGLKDKAAKAVKANVKAMTTRAGKIAAKKGDSLPLPPPPSSASGPPVTTFPLPPPPATTPPISVIPPGDTCPAGTHSEIVAVTSSDVPCYDSVIIYVCQGVKGDFFGCPAFAYYLAKNGPPPLAAGCVLLATFTYPPDGQQTVNDWFGKNYSGCLPPAFPPTQMCPGPETGGGSTCVPNQGQGATCPCGSYATPWVMPDGESGVACGIAPYPDPASSVPPNATPTGPSVLTVLNPDGTPCGSGPGGGGGGGGGNGGGGGGGNGGGGGGCPPPPPPPDCCPPQQIVVPAPTVNFDPVINVNVAGQACDVNVSNVATATALAGASASANALAIATVTDDDDKKRKRKKRKVTADNSPARPEFPVHWTDPASYMFGTNAQEYRDQLWAFMGLTSTEDISTLDLLSESWFGIADQTIDGDYSEAEQSIDIE